MTGGHLEDRLEPPYRSRSEARLGGLFDQYGIPFFYEHPLLVASRGRYRIWHPDFTLPHHGGLIVEYAGMMNCCDYRDGIGHKQQVFADNGVPAVFLYPEDLYGPDWQKRTLDRVLRSHDTNPYTRLPLSYQSADQRLL